jgi:hypothetical protein
VVFPVPLRRGRLLFPGGPRTRAVRLRPVWRQACSNPAPTTQRPWPARARVPEPAGRRERAESGHCRRLIEPATTGCGRDQIAATDPEPAGRQETKDGPATSQRAPEPAGRRERAESGHCRRLIEPATTGCGRDQVAATSMRVRSGARRATGDQGWPSNEPTRPGCGRDACAPRGRPALTHRIQGFAIQVDECSVFDVRQVSFGTCELRAPERCSARPARRTANATGRSDRA